MHKRFALNNLQNVVFAVFTKHKVNEFRFHFKDALVFSIHKENVIRILWQNSPLNFDRKKNDKKQNQQTNKQISEFIASRKSPACSISVFNSDKYASFFHMFGLSFLFLVSFQINGRKVRAVLDDVVRRHAASCNDPPMSFKL